MSAPVVAEIVRSGFVEGHHYGSAVALAPDGEVLLSFGEVAAPMLPRSCNKPLQALGMVRMGLDLPPDLLALACASHSGEPFHVDGVRRILALADLDESALQCPPAYPLEDQARDDVVRRGGGQAPILMNCSGKHAAMLLTCVINGWSIDDYRSPRHPLQVALAETFVAMTGEPVLETPIDGCGAPIFPASLTGLARAFGRLVRGQLGDRVEDQSCALVTEAIRAHPTYVSGTRRDEAALLRAVPGAIAKAGAESCYAVALADGRAIAIKHDDGAPRVRPVVMAAILERLGVFAEAGVDGQAARATGLAPLLGGGLPVGEIRATLPVDC